MKKVGIAYGSGSEQAGAGWDLWCDPVGGNLPRGLGLRSRGRKAPPREAVGRAGGGCREGVAPCRQGGPGV
jgi:hypothetical protein